jgi:hypothetical protein
LRFSGGVYAPGEPLSRTEPLMRDRRKQRAASRSVSWPTTYQRPRQQTTPHG